jgi:hypothetical protein
MRVILRRKIGMNAPHHTAPAARLDQSDNRSNDCPEPDEEELQDLVKYRGSQTAKHDVHRNRERRNPDAEIDVPAEDDF